jgi:tRNA A37 threonylcarbamoyladenosine modification protein TsaB
MHSYIAIQSTQDHFELALFKNSTLIELVREDTRHASKLFIPLLDQLLSNNATALAELSLFVVNCGPAPFSTLRSLIASANGLHCATNTPLIGIDGLEATFIEFYDKNYENTVVLLNAFNNESYYLIAHGKQIVATGYKNTQLLMDEIQEQFTPGSIDIIDNKICPMETIGRLGYEKFIANTEPFGYLMPLHLKKHPVEL